MGADKSTCKSHLWAQMAPAHHHQVAGTCPAISGCTQLISCRLCRLVLQFEPQLVLLFFGRKFYFYFYHLHWRNSPIWKLTISPETTFAYPDNYLAESDTSPVVVLSSESDQLQQQQQRLDWDAQMAATWRATQTACREAHSSSQLCYWFHLSPSLGAQINGSLAVRDSNGHNERLLEAELHLFKLPPLRVSCEWRGKKVFV